MSFDYYYRGNDEEEISIRKIYDHKKKHITIRIAEDDGTTALILLPSEEIDRIIAALQALKQSLPK